jgi:hypothetical protein
MSVKATVGTSDRSSCGGGTIDQWRDMNAPCRRCGREPQDCRCAPDRSALMGLLQEFRESDAPASSPGGFASGDVTSGLAPLVPPPWTQPGHDQPASAESETWPTRPVDRAPSPPGSWPPPDATAPPPRWAAPGSPISLVPPTWPPPGGPQGSPERPASPDWGGSSGDSILPQTQGGTPFPAFASRPRRTVPVVVAAVIVIVLAATVGVIITSQKGVKATSPIARPASASGAPRTQSAGASDNALALQLAVRPQDLGSRWVPLQAQNYPFSVLNDQIVCLPGLPAGHRSAGALSDYSLDLQPNGLEGGHLTSVILLQASAQDSAITRARLLTPGYDACGQSDAISQVTTSREVGARVVAVTPLPTPGGLTGIAERLVIDFTFNGVPDTVTTDLFDVLQGRVEIRTFIQKCSCKPFDSSFEDSLIQSLAVRAEATTYGR